MKFLVVVTPPSIYHGCSTRKTFREEKFTGKQDLFESVNITILVIAKLGNTRRSRLLTGVTLNIYEILNISEKFESRNKMETTSSESKVELEISGKGLVTAMDINTKARSKNTKRQGMPSEMSA